MRKMRADQTWTSTPNNIESVFTFIPAHSHTILNKKVTTLGKSAEATLGSRPPGPPYNPHNLITIINHYLNSSISISPPVTPSTCTTIALRCQPRKKKRRPTSSRSKVPFLSTPSSGFPFPPLKLSTCNNARKTNRLS